MKMMKTLAALTLAASAAMAAEPAETPFYFRASHLVLQEDWADYNGGQTRGHGFEIGYTRPTSEENIITWGLFAGFVKSVGDYRSDLDTSFSVDAFRVGADVVFKTPLDPLRAYAGVNLQHWDGKQDLASSVLGPKKPFGDSKAKFGLRIGLEYRITEHWGVSVDYNASEWVSNQNNSTYPVSGYNPVNPSWVALSVQYRFNAFN